MFSFKVHIYSFKPDRSLQISVLSDVKVIDITLLYFTKKPTIIQGYRVNSLSTRFELFFILCNPSKSARH